MESKKQPSEKEWLREPVVAGRFYPREKAELSLALYDYLQIASTPIRNLSLLKPIAVFAPHAGYIYSGKIAGDLYKTIVVPDRVIILCPNHTGKGARISVWGKGSWRTPLGDIPVDKALSDTFMEKMGGQATLDREAHLYEHAIEVHLPFLQLRNPNLSILPITLGPLHPEAVEAVGRALAATVQAMGERPVLLVASTDMSHFISAESAKLSDRPALDAIERLDPAGLYEVVVKNDISMCGFIPTTAALFAARQLGATAGKVVSYGSSGETSGDYREVVAYAAGYMT